MLLLFGGGRGSLPAPSGGGEGPQPPAPVCGGGQGGGSFRQQQGMSAIAFRNEPGPENFEPSILEPGKVGVTVGVAPVHRRTMPVVLRPGPGTGPDGRQQVAARSKPATQLPKDFGLLLDWHMDDREEGNDRGKAARREINECHIGAFTVRGWHQP